MTEPAPAAPDFTGERFLPALGGEILYEHVHRYAFALRFARGRRVLDVACGEGYGSALLAGAAAAVLGVDVDAATVARARETYAARPHLAFACASGAALPLPDAAIDVVVSFETIEHLPQALQPRFVAELRRVLRPGGLLVLSAPNRVEYSEARAFANPYHLHEHDRAELAALLSPHFPQQQWLHQRLWLGSQIVAEAGGQGAEAWTGDAASVAPASLPPAMYHVVVASDDARALAAVALPARSLFSDDDESELRRRDETVREVLRLDALARERTQDCERLGAWVRHLETLVAERDARILHLDAVLAAHAAAAARPAAEPTPALPVAPERAVAPPQPPATRAREPAGIDVVVPVYNAPDDLRLCVEAVLAHTQGDYRLLLIDDASPDPRVREVFAEVAARGLPHVTLLANERNLGFTGTANRGMTESDRDVVLLNSDAIVTAGWLDALRRCAASDTAIGTITPFSNNAEICSFPALCVNHPWPPGADAEPLRQAIAAAAVPCYPDLPTGVGFCFYVRRALIDAIGGFDPAFGAGYGEENDFCMRAHAAGFRNVLCDDGFVLHTGGRSFAGAKEQLGVRNTALLLERHPGYLDLVRDFIARDPLRPLREAALTARERLHGPQPAVLHLLHGGGGTEVHVRSLVETGGGAFRHVIAFVRGADWRIDEHRSDGSVLHCQFGRRADEAPADFLRQVAAVYGIGVVHVHSVIGDPGTLAEAVAGAGIPYGVTVHDLQIACPTITLQRADGRFCGGVTDAAACDACLAAQPAIGGGPIARWRGRHGALLAGASFVIAPSRWAADLLRRYYPGVRVDVVPHGLSPRDGRPHGALQAVLMPDDGRATVAVLGAVGPDKGARRVERLAELAAMHGAPVRFVVVGYLDTQGAAWRSDDGTLTVHGRYAPGDLPALLDHYRVQLVVFPSRGPESFSYTLSEAWAAGRAVLVPPIGALAERVGEQGGGWIMDGQAFDDDAALLERIVALTGPAQREALDAAASRAAAIALPSLAAMVEQTQAAWRRAAASQRVEHVAIDRLRVVEAYGWRRWTPPEVAAPAVAPAATPPLAQAALRFRHSLAGRAVARLLPASAKAALWSRLQSGTTKD